MPMEHAPELTCAELVELVTDYLEGALPSEERVRFDEHLASCSGCVNYVDQMRTTIELTGGLREEDLSAELQVELLAAFRDWRSGPPV
jgi:predicted anti-sigma-YlaC factor YlaD